MIKEILFVGIGGAAGSILRYVTTLVTVKYYPASFPLATFIVNVAGCFLVGLLFGVMGQESSGNQNLKLLLITGFCGGFTTFSAFAMENVSLVQSGNTVTAGGYIVASIVFGILAVWIGLAITR